MASSKPKSTSTSLAAIPQLVDSVHRGELVAVVGSGVSMALTNGLVPALSWKGLVENGFSYGLKKGKISASQAEGWKVQLSSSDLDDLLAAAEFVGRKLGAPHGELYARWLDEVFNRVTSINPQMENAIRTLQSANIPLCTLNYDNLLERVTGLGSIKIGETSKLIAWMRSESRDVLHLHGIWNAPESCVLGIRDYESTHGNEVRDLIQRSLASFRRLLFIGCGGTFADPNFSALVTWLRKRMKSATPQHYALVIENEVPARHADPTWHGFVEPLSYGRNYKDLAPFLINHFTPRNTSDASTPSKGVEVDEHTKLLADYRAFLLRDCGQMTIEGVRADLDTAQRKFDLERLFVPLKVKAAPPDIPENDPHREEKLRQWLKKNNRPRAFGKVFGKAPHLALLALPGGGKTLLLKRLAVAYADPSRRRNSLDRLQDLDLFPVMIRCREWRDHIHLPILTLLRSLPEITGHASLHGLADALLPLLDAGRILLLVDGLDEIHDDAKRSIFVDHLEAFVDRYKRNRLIVTSREAGFSLVAPVLARFCQRWRVAPLQDDAITALCDHWHALMSGDSPEAQAESREVSDYLLRNSSLRRLAENPLLLTMLLVVKHGAGRLPPDRVTLYSRAVEVLLDTWNIKGHNPLNQKEAVPQLAFVAYELMRAGKQTATERELLELLEEAREAVPQIRRYATDSPDAFLKRVELRSSLLIEAGYQVEKNRPVPFYQFRHLTFQEYLAGIAVAEGHYTGYKKQDTVLNPLVAYLTAEEWKEVIPVVAVLARKQAEPLIAALVTEGERLWQALVAGRDFPGRSEWTGYRSKLPAPIARLVQCLVEEAEATSETLASALRLAALFAQGCRSENDWAALCRGPYGEELLHQAWLLYSNMNWPNDTWLLNTCSTFAALRRPRQYWTNSEGVQELQRMLMSTEDEEIARGLFTAAGFYFDGASREGAPPSWYPLIKAHIFHPEPSIVAAAVWAWALARHREQGLVKIDIAILDRITELWLNPGHPALAQRTAFALTRVLGTPRSEWSPKLTDSQVNIVRDRAENDGDEGAAAALVVAFHAGNIWSDDKLAVRLRNARLQWMFDRQGKARVLTELGEPS
jgi:hypothetical protein